MAQKLSPPKGTHDVLPEDWQLRNEVLDAARQLLDVAGFGRIMTPTFEDTALFQRGVGEHTDVVSKEMYTFADKGDRSLTLRPEGTAPVARSFISNGMQRWPQPVKLWYFAPMFRYEKPQEGRYREHYQIGAEIFGTPRPDADAELITLLATLYQRVGIDGARLRINTIGDATTRPAYRDALTAYMQPHADQLDHDSQVRLRENPMRLFDSKSPEVQALLVDAPKIRDSVSDACAEHFVAVLQLLDAAGIAYDIDDSLVRGFDYYTHTTFEFVAGGLGSQDAIGGGGRYDGLVQHLGGPETPAVGFGAGIERIVLAMKAAGRTAAGSTCDVYVVNEHDDDTSHAFAVAQQLRDAGLRTGSDLLARSRNAQMKQASKLGAAISVLVGPDDAVRLYSMRGREEFTTTTESLVDDARARLEDACATEHTSAPT